MTNEFRILTVCTGNVCRSPAAALMLRQGLGQGVRVDSAGTHALVDRSLDPGMAAALAPLGVRDDGTTARALLPEMVEGADLVLAMARQHRASVAELVPQAVRRLYTLTEFAALLEGWQEDGRVRPFYSVRVPDRLHEFMAVAPRLRGTVRLASGDADIPDPFQLAPEVYRESAQRIAVAVGTIVGCLDGSGPVRPTGTLQQEAAGTQGPSERGLRGLLGRLFT